MDILYTIPQIRNYVKDLRGSLSILFTQAALQHYEEAIKHRINTYHFDSWDRTGEIKTIDIQAANKDDAEILFVAKFPDLGYDEPYE